MMLLAIPAHAMPPTLAKSLRQHGHLLAEADPDDAIALRRLLPFSALLCTDDAELRPHFPHLRILPYAADTTPATLEQMLSPLPQRPPTRRTSLYLPTDRRNAMVLVERIAFTPAEYTLLRVLAEANAPVPSRLLALFLGRPCSRSDIDSIGYHVACIREKTNAAAVPNLISYIHPEGYALAFPYSIRLE